jgi:hypothetical protein
MSSSVGGITANKPVYSLQISANLNIIEINSSNDGIYNINALSLTPYCQSTFLG